MKPYGLVLFNYIKLRIKKAFRCKKLHVSHIEMLSAHVRLRFAKTAEIHFGDRLVSDGRGSIIVDDAATLTIGSHTYFNDGVMISVKSSVSIGEGCRFGPGVKIFDNDHVYNSDTGVSDKHISAPISIGRNCWIAANAVILKGTTIGDNCVIGAGTVVHGTIPPSSVVTASRELIIRPI